MTQEGRRTTQFALIPEWVLYNPKLNSTAIRVYAILERHTDPDRKAFPSQKRLSELSGLGVEAVRRALRVLETEAAIETRRRFRNDGANTSNGYFLPRDETRGASIKNEGGASLASDGGILEREPEVTIETPSESHHALSRRGGGAVAKSPPKTVIVDGRNVPFDALVEATQADPDVEGGRIAKALQTIRRVCWRDLPEGAKAIIDAQTFDQAVAGSIRERAAMYERKYPDVDLTPTALANNWSRVTKGQPHRGGPADIALRNMRERGRT